MRKEPPMKVQHNIPGMNNLNIGKGINSKMAKNLRRLSTGTRISTAADDAAGLAVSEKMRFLIGEQSRCITNTQEGVGVAQTADAALMEVTAMIHRAEQLCIQAKNDTHSEEDRAHISKEINALYDEMERIFTSSEFNGLKLFNADGYNPIGEDSVLREYTETVRDTAPGEALKSWGALDIVNDKQFDLADDATPASVTLRLDNGVILNDASSLNGKSFMLGQAGSSYPVRITFSSSPTASDGYRNTVAFPDGGYYYDYIVSTKNCSTVQDALDHLRDLTNTTSFFTSRNLSLLESAPMLDPVTREVTLTFTPGTLEQTINGSSYQTEGADGASDNGHVLSGVESESLGQVDGNDSANNAAVYSETSTRTFALLPNLSGAMDDTQRAVLTANYLTLTGIPDIRFTTTGEAGKIDITGMTYEDVRSAIVAAINSHTDANGDPLYSASCDASGQLTLTRLNLPQDHNTYCVIRRYANGTNADIPSGTVTTRTIPPTAEKGEQCIVTLPPDLTSDDLPLCLTINSRPCVFYQYTAGQSVSASGVSTYAVSDGQSIYATIADAISYRYSSEVSCTVSGNTITATGKYATKELNISVTGGTATINISNPMLLDSSSYSLVQTVSLPIDVSAAISSESAASDLIGKGFAVAAGTAYYFEFVGNGSTQKSSNSTPIDISGCTTYEEIRAAMEAGLSKRFGGITVTHEGNGKMSIRLSTTSTSYSIIDGMEGQDSLFLNETGEVSLQASGGTTATQPHTTINFAKYNSRNFDELYGKGFRITCATCEGEFINVIFCHDASNCDFPSGKISDVDANGNPITYTNYAVELKDMETGSDIVRNIVDQLKGKLDHFTDIEVGDPTSVLKVTDKRAGNIVQDGNILRAEVLSGVYTNCEYEMTYVEYVNTNAYIGPPGSNTTAYYGYCPIFVGSNETTGDFILVHLPTLSLNLLNLDPPRPDFTDLDSIDDVFERLNVAESVILTARGQLGADQNRLEHAQKNLTVSMEQNTASYSTIKDTDMAEAMTEQTKLSILQNFQQSTLAHIFENASSVLQLLY